MMNWGVDGEANAVDLAVKDVNNSPLILPNTFVDYSYVNHDLNPAVKTIFIFKYLFSYLIFFIFFFVYLCRWQLKQ